MNLAGLAPGWIVILLCLLLLAAAIQDAATLKISNLLVAGVLLLAVAAAFVAGPRLELWQNVAGAVGLLLLGLPLFAAGKLGGGDVKLLSASALWFSFKGLLLMVPAVFITGGALALLLIGTRTLVPATAGARVPALRKGGGVPYGVAIAAGVLYALWAKG